MKTFIAFYFSLCLAGGSQGQSTTVVSEASFSATTFVESSSATLKMGSLSGETSRESSNTGDTLGSSSATINVAAPSDTIDVPLSYVTTRTVNVESSYAESTSAALLSLSRWAHTAQVTTAPISTTDTETGVEATIHASTVKPTITSSVNGQSTSAVSVASFSATTSVKSSVATINVGPPSGTEKSTIENTLRLHIAESTSAALQSVSQWVVMPQVTTAPISTSETGVETTIALTVKPTIISSANGQSTTAINGASFSATATVESSSATLNVGSPSDETSRKSSDASSTQKSSSTIRINVGSASDDISTKSSDVTSTLESSSTIMNAGSSSDEISRKSSDATSTLKSPSTIISAGYSSDEISRKSSNAASTLKSSRATINVGSSSDKISTESSSSSEATTLGLASINVVSPSHTTDVPLSYVTTRTINTGSSIAASFIITTAALRSASQSVKTSQVTTASTSTSETVVEATIASKVKPSISSSVNEDECNNYLVLSEADRAQGQIVTNSNYRCDRDDLVPGWYRFQGAAGHQMADKCVTINYCGTQHPGWLNGSHPTVAEGVVTRKVCYHYRDYYWYGSNNCCRYSNNIRVRNCGAFFVYELQKLPSCDFRYCGNASGAVDGCNNYTVLSEADRAQGQIVIDDSNYRCDRDDLVPGWYRFQGAAGDQMADKCVPTNYCGTLYPGWLSGTHPTIAEGVVTRKVCYHYWDYYWYGLNNCCYYSNNIRVRNCGAFFVYELQKPPTCDLRYCGNASRAVDGCNNYTVLSEADRAQGQIVINDTNYGCDRDDLVPGWYRFQGAAGDQMADKCVPTNYCGTRYPGWLNGTHPTVAEGVVTRKVCYDRWDYYWYESSSCCYYSNNIRVRNCGAFFVYELQKPPYCDLRYCGNASGTADGCNNHTVLNEVDRAQGQIVINDSNYRCDRDDLVPGWYRFQGAAGDQMADKCVPTNYCGTQHPGWLSGSHPTVAEGVVTRKVCYGRWNYYRDYYYDYYWHDWSRSCCYYSNNIRVRNCGAFFVYELQKPPYCDFRYCGNASGAGNSPYLVL